MVAFSAAAGTTGYDNGVRRGKTGLDDENSAVCRKMLRQAMPMRILHEMEFVSQFRLQAVDADFRRYWRTDGVGLVCVK